MTRIAIAILAAGQGRRMGPQIKQLLRFENQPLLVRTVLAASASQVGDVFVVLGYQFQMLSELLKASQIGGTRNSINVIDNPLWQEGLSSSIRAAVSALSDYDAILFMTVDQPFVDAACIKSLAAAFISSDRDVVASTYGDPPLPGIPAIFGQNKFGALTQLQGDRGAKQIIASSNALLIASDLAAYDIDTSHDLKNCIDIHHTVTSITH